MAQPLSQNPSARYRFSLPRVIVYALSLIVMALFGLGLLVKPETAGWSALLAPLFLLLISGIALLILLRQLKFFGQDVVVIGPEGILDRRLSARPLPWDQILAAEIKKASLTKTLVVVKSDNKTVDLDFILLNAAPHNAFQVIQAHLAKG